MGTKKGNYRGFPFGAQGFLGTITNEKASYGSFSVVPFKTVLREGASYKKALQMLV